MLANCELDSKEQISVIFESEFIQENSLENVVYQNGGHFVQEEMC